MSQPIISEAISSLCLTTAPGKIEVPSLSTLSNKQYFQRADIKTMLDVIRQIRGLDCSEPTRQFLLLGVAASLDRIANLRKDGRALRYTKKLDRPSASVALRATWEQMCADVGERSFTGKFSVFKGTATDLKVIEQDSVYDMVLYSPPYLNNFDYSEVYKLELWTLGFLSSKEEWRDLRRSSLRSHPSVKFHKTAYLADDPATSDIHTKLVSMQDLARLTGERNDVIPVIPGYFDDMYLALKEQWRVLKSGGILLYVVANSRHKHLPIATDVILGTIASRIGFEPLEIVVLKKRNGRTRQKKYLRETAVILRKP